jgi:dipeptidase
MIPYIQDKQKQLEQKFMLEIKDIDKTAADLYKKDPKKAIALLTDYSVKSGDQTVVEWKKLYCFLFTRYMDGNVKTKVEGQQNPTVEQPGYSEDWYRAVVKQSGDKFRLPEEKK